MFREQGVDVIIAADPATPPLALLGCVQAVLTHSDYPLRQISVIAEATGATGRLEQMQDLPRLDARVRLVCNTSGLGLVACINRALADAKSDVVLLAGDRVVDQGWLRELAEVAHSEERTACASPLTETELDGPAARSGLAHAPSAGALEVSPRLAALACEGLPRWTVAPVLPACCVYVRGDILAAVGRLSPELIALQTALDDWVMRALELGFSAKRANHIYVQRTPLVALSAPPASIDHDGPAILSVRHPYFERQIKDFSRSLDGRIAAHALGVASSGRLPVALDIRHLTPEQVGTRTYALGLARALAALPELELTLLVRDPAQAEGLSGRVVTPETWCDDVAVIHKPAQVVDPSELALLFRSAAHVVITYQDLIGYRIPSVFPTDESFDCYRATSGPCLHAVQKTIAYSETSAREIASEFGIPRQEIAVVPVGVDAEWFALRRERDERTRSRLRLPAHYFFSVATDFPHKNLPNLLDAYTMLRERWKEGEPPALVLAGHTSGGRTPLYRSIGSSTEGDGILILGPVSPDDLRVLYQRALAVVYPSLYEGFGLPPLESMAAGTPVIAMPISAVPEVVDDAVLYPDGLAPSSLADAMANLATDSAVCALLRERGRARIRRFRWEDTARATYEVYRTSVWRPSQRALRMRRLWSDALIHWATDPAHALSTTSAGFIDHLLLDRSIGIRNAVKVLSVALRDRLRREIGRLPGSGVGKQAG
jgi:glycosyltransferase involved in cell wall biosynthesis